MCQYHTFRSNGDSFPWNSALHAQCCCHKIQWLMPRLPEIDFLFVCYNFIWNGAFFYSLNGLKSKVQFGFKALFHCHSIFTRKLTFTLQPLTSGFVGDDCIRLTTYLHTISVLDFFAIITICCSTRRNRNGIGGLRHFETFFRPEIISKWTWMPRENSNFESYETVWRCASHSRRLSTFIRLTTNALHMHTHTQGIF